jgi:hypothetical protein
VVNAFDALDAKAVNARLRFETAVGTGTLILGGNLLFDHLPQTPDHAQLDERIVGLHAAYLAPRLSVIGELYEVRHAGAPGIDATTRAGFAEIGYRVFEEVTPYALIDFVAYPDGGDPYFVAERSHVTGTVGARWLVAEAMALKVQASRAAGDLAETRFSAQFAFGF